MREWVKGILLEKLVYFLGAGVLDHRPFSAENR